MLNVLRYGCMFQIVVTENLQPYIFSRVLYPKCNLFFTENEEEQFTIYLAFLWETSD